MRINFDDTRRPARVAKLLRACFDAHGILMGLSGAQDACARLYGYGTYHELKLSLGKDRPSPWDESCPAALVEARRAYQVQSLATSGLPLPAARAFVDANRPTGMRRHQRTNGIEPFPSTQSRGTGPAASTDAGVPIPTGIRPPSGVVPRIPFTGQGPTDGNLLDRLLTRALREGASDIHVEPRSDSYAVYFRRLGDRMLIHIGPLEEYGIIVPELKARSRMDLAERRIGQDGGFQVEYSGKYVDLRVATVPAVEGEQVIIRLLDPDRVRPKLGHLGISGVDRWKRGITRRNGLCLICGATGSGRTTTLNASVRELDRFGKKIHAAEDPVEYRIPYVGQVSLNSGLGHGFAQAIRNFMRADPDVMILGEVRDPDTARNAVKAAETGHLVIGTIASGNVLSAIDRFMECGVPAHELRFILRSVLVQSLVKVVCTSCGGHGHDGGATCLACHGGGYSDRTVVSECASFGSHTEFEEAVVSGRGSQPPWQTMIDDGIAKMRKGITTSEELQRNFGSRFDDRMIAMGLDPEEFVLAKNRKAKVLA